MFSTQVYINASELKCSQVNNELTQESLTDVQLLNKKTSDTTHNSENFKFRYKSINNETLTQDNLEGDASRIFKILFDVFDSLLRNHQLTKKQLANTVLFLGSSSMDISEIKSTPDSPIWLTPIDKITKTLSKRYGLSELDFTFSTACTSSANAIIYATRLLKTKRIERAIVLGCEFYNQLTLSGFLSLDLLSKDYLSAFSNKRNGMILGEGVGALMLSTKTDNKDDIEILSGYSSCDTFSLTSSKEDGSHITNVIKKSIDMSEIKAEEIDIIKVHGTASPTSDDAELNSLKGIFSKPPPIFALKPFIGHTLGASAAIETAVTHQLIKKNQMRTPDYAEQTNQCLLAFAPKKTNINDYQYILHNYCGFGGNNAAIVFKNRRYISD